MADYLSQSKPSSRHVLCILFEASVDDSWVPNATLEKDCSLSRSSLSNIMKRLVQAKAVEFYKEGRTVSYPPPPPPPTPPPPPPPPRPQLPLPPPHRLGRCILWPAGLLNPPRGFT
jgi:hypothetical protein